MWSIIIALIVTAVGLSADIIQRPPTTPGMNITVRRARRYSPRVKILTSSQPACSTAMKLHHSPAIRAVEEKLDLWLGVIRVEKMICAIRHLPDKIIIDRNTTFTFEGGVPQARGHLPAFQTWIGPASLIGTDGPFGRGWTALIRNMAVQHIEQSVHAIMKELSFDQNVKYVIEGEYIRWANIIIGRLDPEFTARERFWLARSINSMARPSLLDQLRLFGDWVDSDNAPDDAPDRILADMAQWEFNPLRLGEKDFTTVWSYVSLQRDILPYVEYELEGTWQARTVEDMRTQILNYATKFDGATSRYSTWMAEEANRRQKLSIGPSAPHIPVAPAAPPAPAINGVEWNGNDQDYIEYDLLDDDLEFEDDRYLAHGASRAEFKELPKRDNLDRRLRALKHAPNKRDVKSAAAIRRHARKLERERERLSVPNIDIAETTPATHTV